MAANLGPHRKTFRINTIGAPDSDQMEGVLDIINRRVNLFGTDEPIIQRFGDDRIIVQLPGASGSVTEISFVQPAPEAADAETLRSVLIAAGYDDLDIDRLDDRSFRIQSATVNAEKRQAAQEALAQSLGAIGRFQVTSAIDNAKALIGETAQLEFKERTCIDITCTQFEDSDIGLTGDDLSQAFARAEQVGIGWEIVVHFDGRGTEIFSDLTERIHTQQDTKRIAIFLDGQPLRDAEGTELAPRALAWIRDGVTRITGNFTREEARTFAIQFEAGSLPVPLKLIQENDVSALLGSESLRNSLIAGIVGLVLVMAFMVAYYRMAGVVASLALVFFAVVELAIFKLVPITLTLSHIGGFILSIGMAVDANVLIFERMKEEMRIGRTLASSMEVGFNRAWPAIRDGNISTLITCGVLLWFGDRLGGGLVTGFAISLGIGVLLSMFTAVVLSRNLLQLLAWAGFRDRAGLFTPEGVQRAAPTPRGGGLMVLDVVRKRAWYFLFSALIILPGLVSMILPPGWLSGDSGLNAGIDFASGSILIVTFDREASEDQIQDRMNRLGHSEALIQRVGGREFQIRTTLLEEGVGDAPSEREVIERDLEESLQLDRGKVEFASVSPIVAKETVRNAFYSIAAASVFIMLYVWYAFRRVPKAYRYGISAILALVHDVIFVLGVFSILGKVIGIEVNSMFIVGILIVAGYSVNDTIVVFDRIRENVARSPDRDLGALVNLSIMDTVGRSLNTSLTTLFVLVAMLLIGGPSIRGLLLVVAIGAIVGTYSSIFIASQFLVMWDRGEIGRFFRRGRRAPAVVASSLMHLIGR